MQEVSGGVLVEQGDRVVHLDVHVVQNQHQVLSLGGHHSACCVHTLYISYLYIHYEYIHVLVRDEKKGRKKQARSNKQTRQCTCFNERRKKQARSNKQQLRQSNIAHPRWSLFPRKMSCLEWDSNSRHSCIYLHALPSAPLILYWVVPSSRITR